MQLRLNVHEVSEVRLSIHKVLEVHHVGLLGEIGADGALWCGDETLGGLRLMIVAGVGVTRDQRWNV